MVVCSRCGADIPAGETGLRDGNEIICRACDRLLAERAARVFAAERSAHSGMRTSENLVGMIGFVLSIVSLLFFFGVASPISLCVSLFGLKKEPRGFAIAGTIISALGTALLCCLIIVICFAPLIVQKVLDRAIKNAPSHTTSHVLPVGPRDKIPRESEGRSPLLLGPRVEGNVAKCVCTGVTIPAGDGGTQPPNSTSEAAWRIERVLNFMLSDGKAVGKLIDDMESC